MNSLGWNIRGINDPITIDTLAKYHTTIISGKPKNRVFLLLIWIRLGQVGILSGTISLPRAPHLGRSGF
jgi:hypothetical protein